ncbi:MAG: 4Fe-4S binding protein [Selenomonas sp.]|uniref:4Fe-4S binding protein n=1 Tax=Selenomonas sp. TaxID=2053611 RepID=UPI0025DBEC36|nr:4Fe-4S binding protein [Selenomonas sp.]MCR5440445.1 4Fe-4S binding protein [Selenomonas sp.]
MAIPVRKRQAKIDPDQCVACGTCFDTCPQGALSIFHGSYAQVDFTRCIGCGLCARECPADIIQFEVSK